MIGFNINVTSNIGYNPGDYSSWTEGSLWMAKTALSKAAVKGTNMFTPDLLAGIESKFGNIKNALLTKVGGIDNMFFVGFTGSVSMYIQFDPTQPAEMIIWKFLQTIRTANYDLGDQVMIQLCKHIADFDQYISLYGTKGVNPPIMWITLDL